MDKPTRSAPRATRSLRYSLSTIVQHVNASSITWNIVFRNCLLQSQRHPNISKRTAPTVHHIELSGLPFANQAGDVAGTTHQRATFRMDQHLVKHARKVEQTTGA